MSQQVIVDRDLEFRGAALYQANVKGPMMSELKIFDETFFADADEHDWTETAYGTTFAHAALEGGATTVTAGGVDDDCGEFTNTAQWSPYRNCGMEVWLKISQITAINVCAGFADVITNTDDRVAMEFDGAVLKALTNTKDVAGFMFDTDGSGAAVWYYVVAEGGVVGTVVAATGTRVPVADTYVKLRVQTDSDGNVTYYYNGIPVGFKTEAVASSATDLLTPYVGFISRSTAAAVCTVSRIVTWQDGV